MLEKDINKSARPDTRVYLDLDGVIYPIQHLDKSDVDLADVDKLHNLEWWRKSVAERIGALSVEVVLASSWGESFLKTSRTVASPRESLGAQRALPITSQHLTKCEAVAADLAANPANFIWIDDDLTTDMKDYVKQNKPAGTKGLFVKPYDKQGLTPDELEAIEQTFVNQLDN